MSYDTIVHPPITSHDIMVVSFVSLGLCVYVCLCVVFVYVFVCESVRCFV